MNLRRGRRATALVSAFISCMVRLGLLRLRGPLTPLQRARWLQSASRGVVASLGLDSRIRGTAPSHGLVVSNHLSYLDILVYSAVMPCVFVSKAEIAQWPYFGLAARAGGTIFLDRASRTSAAAAVAEIAETLKQGVPVLLFPEGTSTDGRQVLRFHSTLFQPAVDAGAPVIAASVRYVAEGNVPESAMCWFGEDGFVAHVWKLLSLPGFSAEISFGEPVVYRDRRVAAQATHEYIEDMRFAETRVREAAVLVAE